MSVSFTSNNIKAKVMMESPNRKNGYFSYFKSCFDTIKNTIMDYQSYSSRYDRYQMQYNAIESEYNPYHVTEVTQKMERLLKAHVPRNKRIKTMATNVADNIKHTFIYGAFAVTSLVWTDQKSIEDIIYRPCIKSMPDYSQIMESQNTLDGCENTNETLLCTNNLINSQNVKNSNRHDDKQYIPSKRTFDDTWGFINDDLSIQYKDAFAPPKPPRRIFRYRQ